VVLLADLGKRFRFDAPIAGMRIEETLGLCPTVITPDRTRAYPSVAQQLAERSGRAHQLAEELRLLYVAMTRACDQLILLGSTAESRPKKLWNRPAPTRLTVSQLLGAGSYLDLLGPLLPELCNREDWYEQPAGASDWLRWSIVGPDEVVMARAGADAPDPGRTDVSVAAESPDFHRLAFRYPFLEATRLTGKTTVTRLRKQMGPTEDEESASLFGDEPGGGARRPPGVGGSRRDLSAAAIGVAYHTCFQHIHLESTGSAAAIESELDRMEKAGVLTQSERAVIHPDRVLAFWSGEIGREFRTGGSRVHRELPFTAAFTHSELNQLAGAPSAAQGTGVDLVVVQGVADLVLIRDHEIWILDFKTDRIDQTGLNGRVALYRPQVRLYQRALERTCRRPVTRLWLHFLHLNQTVEVNPG